MQWHKMSKKSLIGRIIILPVFIIILVVELILNKADDWSYSIRIKQSPLNAGLLFTL